MVRFAMGFVLMIVVGFIQLFRVGTTRDALLAFGIMVALVVVCALLSPVLPTATHPEATGIGWDSILLGLAAFAAIWQNGSRGMGRVGRDGVDRGGAAARHTGRSAQKV